MRQVKEERERMIDEGLTYLRGCFDGTLVKFEETDADRRYFQQKTKRIGLPVKPRRERCPSCGALARVERLTSITQLTKQTSITTSSSRVMLDKELVQWLDQL